MPRRNRRTRKHPPKVDPPESDPTPDQLARRLVERGICSHLILIPPNRTKANPQR